MKKLLFLGIFSLILILPNQSYARKSDFIISLKTGFNGLTGDFGKDFNTGYNGSLNFEYFFKDNFSGCFGLGGNYFKAKTVNYGGWSVEQYIADADLSFGIRYYFADIQKKITPYIGIDGYYLEVVQHAERTGAVPTGYDKEKNETTGLEGIAPVVGILYPLGRNFHLSLTAKYTFTFQNVDTEDDFMQYQTQTYFSDYHFWSIQLGFCFVM